jgi:hypothetical protein
VTSSSTLRRIFGIITAVGTLVAGVMYATAPTGDGEPPGVGSGSGEPPVAQAPTSESYQRGEEDAHGNGVGDIESLRREVALLRGDLATVRRRLEQLARRAVEAEQQDAAHGAAVPEGIPSIDRREDLAAAAAERQRIEAESEQRILAQAEANEAALQKETEDSAWSGEAYDLINSAVAAEDLAGTSLHDVECRATLCRIEVTHKDRQARGAFEGQLIMAVAPLLPQAMMQTVENEDGSTSSVLYLARDGHDFPQPETMN